MKYVVTGRPGVGKSTLFSLVIENLRENGFIVGGISTPEVRGEDGRRIGFRVVDLLSGKSTWLAKRGYYSPVRIGAYGVFVKEASSLIAEALDNALSSADVIGVDEVGPMELKLPVFKTRLLKTLDSKKPVILVVHYRLREREILDRLRNATWIYLTLENREKLREVLPEKILGEIRGAGGIK